ncbi:hypothetical protein BDA99DRAFT_568095 [Phascolomyces articulosus]|uniref:Uncharacterized protein n=1 Tax=Phascolomyces articulosus TaxID=60185 RepID=A0AAD5KBC6_9FUNG|nr:hypothetical protein BDA99DRAFT_568095 [Phascolomyces articulosus]
MSTSTARPQKAAILIEEGSLETGKRKFTETSKTDKEAIIELLNEVLQQKLKGIVHENASKYTKDEFVTFLEKKINCPKDNASTSKSTTPTATKKSSKNDNDDEDKVDDKNKRTSSIIRINSILREDMSHEHVQKVISQAAAHTTTAVSNVSVLVRMTLCKLAQHQITIKDDNAQLKKEQSGYQMSKIFPASFTIRVKRPMDEKGKNSTNDPNHPFWNDLTFKNCNLRSITQGISTTIASGIKEFSTNFKNMWDGTTIYKRIERKNSSTPAFKYDKNFRIILTETKMV